MDCVVVVKRSNGGYSSDVIVNGVSIGGSALSGFGCEVCWDGLWASSGSCRVGGRQKF